MGRGYQGAPKGGALAAAGLPLGIKSPADGDLLAYDLASGKWVNSGNLKIGAEIEASSVALSNTGALTALPLDQMGSVYFLNGFVVDEAGTGLIVPIAGRYRIAAVAMMPSDSTNDLVFTLTANVTNGEIGSVFIPHAVPGGQPFTVLLNALLELHAGATIHYQVSVTGAAATISDSYLSAQYVGPATSL